MFASSRQRPQRRRMGRCAEAGCRTLPGEGLAHLFPGRRGVRQSRCLRVPRSRTDQIRNTVASELHPASKDRPSADAPNWAATERSAALLCELHLSSRELDKIPPGRRQVEWHPGELYPRVGFIVTNMARPAENVVAFYNKRGTCEQWMFVYSFMRWPTISAIFCARWRRR